MAKGNKLLNRFLMGFVHAVLVGVVIPGFSRLQYQNNWKPDIGILVGIFFKRNNSQHINPTPYLFVRLPCLNISLQHSC